MAGILNIVGLLLLAGFTCYAFLKGKTVAGLVGLAIIAVWLVLQWS